MRESAGKKEIFKRTGLVVGLLVLNLVFFRTTEVVLKTIDQQSTSQNKTNIPFMDRGMQIINFGFNVIDYLRKFGDKQSSLLNEYPGQEDEVSTYFSVIYP